MDKRQADELLACKYPNHYGGVYGWYKWTSSVYTPGCDDLPPVVWNRLPVDRSKHAGEPGWWKYYSSLGAATDALLAAVRSLL